MIMPIFYKILLLAQTNVSKENAGTPFVNTSGNTKTLYTYATEPDIASMMGTVKQDDGNTAGVIFGTGTTPPTKDDYYLSGDLITGFTETHVTTRTYDENGFTISTLYTITNTGTEDFTIGEVGLSGLARYSTNASYTERVLCERTVLDTPVTIPAGGIGQVTYTIRINYPTA